MTVDQQFNTINEKLQLLVRQQQRLKKENERLRTELDECKTKEEGHLQKIEELNQQVHILKFAAGEMNEKDKKNFERKINQYIKEIDRCIAYLSL